MSVAECEMHLTSCRFNNISSEPVMESSVCPSCGDAVEDSKSMGSHLRLICPNKKVACTFATAGCTVKLPRFQLGTHLASQTSSHMQLLAGQLNKIQQTQQAGQVLNESEYLELPREDDKNARSQPGSPPLRRDHQSVLRLSGSNIHSQSRLIRELYQRVVMLEQTCRRQEIRADQLEQQLSRAEERDGRYCNGSFLWRINKFSEIHHKMRNCHSFLVYSRSFYSSVFGYRMCLRSNLYYSEGEEYLGVFLHLMKGEQDDCLSWPWMGTIKITVINQRGGILREHFSETIDSLPGLAAFEKPEEDLNARGFGFQEFIRVNSLFTDGYLTDDDCLVIKADVKCRG